MDQGVGDWKEKVVKKFEHVVIDTNHGDLQETLDQWARDGYELVAVIQTNNYYSTWTLFFKREVTNGS